MADSSDQWGLFKFKHVRWSLKIMFPTDRPPLNDLRKVRKLLERFRDISAAEFLTHLGASYALDIGSYSVHEGENIVKHGEELGLIISKSEGVWTSYTLYNLTTHREAIIKDNELNRVLTDSMLATGMPILGEFDENYRTSMLE